jgi:small GTP-binding protein
MPTAGELPRSIAGLARLNALEVHDQLFEQSMRRLADYVGRWGAAEPWTEAQPGPEQLDPAAVRAEPPAQFKVSMVGAAGVGKTSLVRRFVHSMFSESYLTTVGVQISKKELTLGGRPLSMILWDLAGDEEGSPVRLSHVRGSSGLILVADGCRRTTLDTAEDLRRRIVEAYGPVPCVLGVNKVDLHDDWQVGMEELEALARACGPTFTTSAKTGKAVDDLFVHLARAIIGRPSPS